MLPQFNTLFQQFHSFFPRATGIWTNAFSNTTPIPVQAPGFRALIGRFRGTDFVAALVIVAVHKLPPVGEIRMLFDAKLVYVAYTLAAPMFACHAEIRFRRINSVVVRSISTAFCCSCMKSVRTGQCKPMRSQLYPRPSSKPHQTRFHREERRDTGSSHQVGPGRVGRYL